jgi:arabinofuranosyltransferase
MSARVRLAAFAERRFAAVLAAAIAALVALAWCHRFVQDDAFIAFRYADHLARGHGLVFNPGERVEGYSCFLYVLLVAAGIRLGFDPVPVSYAIGLASFAGTLAATFALARRRLGSRLAALAALVLTGTHYTVMAFATGGLETQLHAFLVTSFLALGAAELDAGERREGPRPARLALGSVVAALAILTRLDAALLVLPMGLALAWASLERGDRWRDAALRWLALLAPAALLVGAWLMWKQAYYGSLLPNTYYVKVESRASLGQGLYFLYRFVTTYWLEAGLLFAAWKWRSVLCDGRAAVALTAGAALWVAYVVAVGGDWMEFRLFVPVMPLIAIALVRVMTLLERRAGLGWALGALVVVGSIQHGVVYNRTSHRDGIQSVWHLQSLLWAEEENWVGIGRTLHGLLAGDSSVVIATTAAGAIPYYSGLTTIDMLGLNDRWIARHGPTRHATPGHRRQTTLDYLIERRVTLVLGHPLLVWEATPGPLYVQDYPVPRYEAGQAAGRRFPAGLRAIEIPIDRGYRLVALYLTPDATVDRLIAERGWRVREVADRDAQGP